MPAKLMIGPTPQNNQPRYGIRDARNKHEPATPPDVLRLDQFQVPVGYAIYLSLSIVDSGHHIPVQAFAPQLTATLSAPLFTVMVVVGATKFMP
jgi:hypothetical protein